MKRIIDREEAEKICKRLTDEADRFLRKLSITADLAIWLKKASTEATQLERKASELIHSQIDYYGRFSVELHNREVDDEAISLTLSEAFSKAEKLEGKANALAEKVTEIIAKLTSPETKNKGE